MSALLFNLYLDSCLQGIKQSDMGVKVGDLSVNCLLYADDAVLIASSEYEWQALVTTLKKGCESNGLSLNASKIKVLIFEKNEERTKCKMSLNGKILEEVNEVVYLGSMFSRGERDELDAGRHIATLNRVNGALAALMHVCLYTKEENEDKHGQRVLWSHSMEVPNVKRICNEIMTKKIYDGKVSGKRDKKR